MDWKSKLGLYLGRAMIFVVIGFLLFTQYAIATRIHPWNIITASIVSTWIAGSLFYGLFENRHQIGAWLHHRRLLWQYSCCGESGRGGRLAVLGSKEAWTFQGIKHPPRYFSRQWELTDGRLIESSAILAIVD